MKKIAGYLSERLQKISLIALSIGIVYLWFGLLKFFPNISPAEELARNTVDRLTFGLIPPNISFILLAIWETVIGLLLILNMLKRFTIVLALVHMVCTFTPLFFFPEVTFTEIPFSLTLTGQYIIKNVIIIGALVMLLIEHRKSPRAIV